MVSAIQTRPLSFAARRRSASRTSSAARSVAHCICRASAKVDQRTSAVKIGLSSSFIQRWWDRQLGVGQTLNGAPTAAGKEIIRQAAGDLPQVRALLDFLPAATAPLNQTVQFVRNGQTFVVPVGSLTGSQSSTYDDWQASIRIDHRFNDMHTLNGRYLYQDSGALGSIPGVAASQITPPGFSSIVPQRTQGVNLQFTSVLSPRWINEVAARFCAVHRRRSRSIRSSELIPSIEVVELGLRGFNAGPTRTAIGLGVNRRRTRSKHFPAPGQRLLHHR